MADEIIKKPVTEVAKEVYSNGVLLGVQDNKAVTYDAKDLVNENLNFGKVQQGDDNVVSGGEVYDSIKEFASGVIPINLSTETPTQNGVFEPLEVGTYPNFGGLELTQQEKESSIVYFYLLNGVFSKQVKTVSTSDIIESNRTNAVSSRAVYNWSVRNVKNIAELRTIQGVEGQEINLLGYYEAGDKPALLYKWVSGVAEDDGGSVIVSGNGYWSACFVDSVDIRDFGAKDGIDNTIFIQNAINKMLTYDNLLIPKFKSLKVNTLTIPNDIHSIVIKGIDEYSKIEQKEEDKFLFLINCENVKFENITLIGNDLDIYSYIIKDNRGGYLNDFDLNINSCRINNTQHVIYAKGRGVIITNSTFYRIRYTIIDFYIPNRPDYVSDNDIQSYENSFRGYIFKNNRIHYSPCVIINNIHDNRKLVQGISIIGNFLEGPCGIIEGAAKNFISEGNLRYHATHVKEALYWFYEWENISINDSSSGMDNITDGFSRNINKLAKFSLYGSNLFFNGNVLNVLKNCFEFLDGGENINININASKISIETTPIFLMKTKKNKFKNILIKGNIYIDNSLVDILDTDDDYIHNITCELNINGQYRNLHNISQYVDRNRVMYNKYIQSNGVENIINLKIKPVFVRVTNKEGKSAISTTLSSILTNENISINGFNITLKGELNIYGEIYFLEYY